MPAKSKKQQQLMAIAEHNPSKVYSKNRGVLKMKKKALHEFASTKTKGLHKNILKAIVDGKGGSTLMDLAKRRRGK